MLQIKQGKNPWITAFLFPGLALALCLGSMTSCNSSGGAKSPKVSLIPLQSTGAGASFTFDIAPFLTDDTNSVTFSVLTGGGSFTGSVYSGSFPTLGSFTVTFRAADFRGKFTDATLKIQVTSAELALVKNGSGIQLYETTTGDLKTALGDDGTVKTFKTSLTDGRMIFEFTTAAQQDLHLHDPNTPSTTAIADDSSVDEVYVLKTSDDRVVYMSGASPSRRLFIWNGSSTQITAGGANLDERNAMVTSDNLIYFESATNSLADIYYYDVANATVVAVSTHAKSETLVKVLPNNGVVFSRLGDGGETDLFYWKLGAGVVEIGADLTDKVVTTNPFTMSKTFKGNNSSSQIIFEGNDGTDTDVFYWDPAIGTTTSVANSTNVETFAGTTGTGKFAWKDTIGSTDQDLHLFNPSGQTSRRMLNSAAATTYNGTLSNGDVVFTVNVGGTNTDIYLFADAGSADSATAFASNAANETYAKVLSNDAVVYTLGVDVFSKPLGLAAVNRTGGVGTNVFVTETSAGDFIISRTVSSLTDVYMFDVSAGSLVAVATDTGNETYQAVSAAGLILFNRITAPATTAELFVFNPSGPTTTVITTNSVDDTVVAVITAVGSN